MFFRSFPKLIIKMDGKDTVVTDIFRRVSVNRFANDFIDLQTITIPDGFTIEQVADKYYGDPNYHWVIMILNDIIDARTEWPMNSWDLDLYCKTKYGSDGMYEVHHYRTTDENKYIVDFDAADLANGDIEEVTNLIYETELNESKREIKILPPKYIGSFEAMYKSMIS
jgi:hypothetical protein